MLHTSFFDRCERTLKISLFGSLLLLAVAYFQKDRLPSAGFFDQTALTEPLQTPVQRSPFETRINNQVYTVRPLFEYQLNGVVVSDYESGSFGDIYHHRRWKDFLNVKDLCVVWGDNVHSGVFQKMKYDSGPWTCFVQAPDQQAWAVFNEHQLSNNHLLTDNLNLHHLIMSAAPGDQITLRGVLAEYENPSIGFERGTSITRTDTGNGACETIYVTDFAIIKEANKAWRVAFQVSGLLAMASAFFWLVVLLVRPAKRPYR
ncbi:MAG: hypothetical protein GY889_09685 [Proteobacteria bacterium]|nr:hypothetical protein [Pseudomonadota bacterium]HJP06556.1 hypothetical protein [Arenicellales bacterium]